MKLNFKKQVAYLSLIFLIAFLFRVYRLNLMGIDYYGDTYHHWLISYLTAKNNFIYTDFKPKTMNLVWLPLYHYLIAFLMSLTGIWNVSILHWFNIILGSLTCMLIYILMLQISNDDYLGFFAGLSLAIQPWFIELNVLGLTETLTVFFLILTLIFYFRFNLHFLPVIIGLFMLTRYEAWFFSGFLVLTLLFQKKKRAFFNCFLSIILIFLIWCLWSYINVLDPLAWFKMQKNMVEWDWIYIYGKPSLSLKRIIEYPKLIMNVTSNLFLLGLISGVLNFKKRELRLIFILTIFYAMLLSIQFCLGKLLLHARHTIYFFPLTSILYTHLFLNKRKNLMNKAVLLLIVLIPAISLNSMITIKSSKSLEVKAGEALKNIYDGGFVISDSPTIIYFSGIPPEKFYSTNNLFWYKNSWNKTELQNWLLNHNVKYIVWENVSYSASWWLFPDLKENQILKFDDITLVEIFDEKEYSLNIKIFKVIYEH